MIKKNQSRDGPTDIVTYRSRSTRQKRIYDTSKAHVTMHSLAQQRTYLIDGGGFGGVITSRSQRHLASGALADSRLQHIPEKDFLDRRRRKRNATKSGLRGGEEKNSTRGMAECVCDTHRLEKENIENKIQMGPGPREPIMR